MGSGTTEVSKLVSLSDCNLVFCTSLWTQKAKLNFLHLSYHGTKERDQNHLSLVLFL